MLQTVLVPIKFVVFPCNNWSNVFEGKTIVRRSISFLLCVLLIWDKHQLIIRKIMSQLHMNCGDCNWLLHRFTLLQLEKYICGNFLDYVAKCLTRLSSLSWSNKQLKRCIVSGLKKPGSLHYNSNVITFPAPPKKRPYLGKTPGMDQDLDLGL